MEIPWDKIANADPTVMAVCGAIVPFIPNINNRKEKGYCLVGFIALGIITLTAQDIDRKQLIPTYAYDARGGESYCYFPLNIDERTSISAPYQLFMPVVGRVSDSTYWSG